MDTSVLDLRHNTGGRLSSARGVCGAFMGADKVVLVKANRNETISVKSSGEHVFRGIPVVCLIDHYSASASEAFAGALRDNLGVKLIGTKSYGKGSIQENKEIDAGVILITTFHWTTPKGHVVNGRGLDPDIKVTASESGTKYKEDGPLDRAIRELLGE
ncbi:MAG: S41 family peptidase [Patescibacteria group bacterium]